MAFDFPNAPTTGTLYDTGTGVVYAWDGVAWVVTSVTRATARRPNRVVNGNMAISQENGTNSVTTTGAFAVDQWMSNQSGLSMAAQQGTGQVSPFGTRTILGLQFTVAKASLAAGDYGIAQQAIEGLNLVDLGWGTANALPAVVRVNAQTDTPGSYSLAIRNAAGTQSFTKLLSLTTSWQTFVIPIPAITAGVWAIDNTSGMQISMAAAVGTTYTASADNQWNAGNFLASPGQTNLAAATSKYLRFTDVGLYADPDATGLPPPWEVPDYATELVRCMRYWEQCSGASIYGYQPGAGVSVMTAYGFKQKKRVIPAMSAVTWTGVSSNATAAATYDATTDGVSFGVNTLAAGSIALRGMITVANARM